MFPTSTQLPYVITKKSEEHLDQSAIKDTDKVVRAGHEEHKKIIIKRYQFRHQLEYKATPNPARKIIKN